MLRRVALSAAALLLTGALLVGLAWFGVIPQHVPNRQRYPVRGVDVSHWQGDIDWPTLAGQDLSFAFIKATEGSTHADERFQENWQAAQDTHLRVGAYHFFSFDSPGKTQAVNFIANVPAHAGMLPPVIDVEFYGDSFRDPPEREKVQRELTAMADALAAHYGVRPILYTTRRAYDLYIADAYPDCDIWIRGVWHSPDLSDGRDWTFWQYSDRTRLEGYAGEEGFIDMNLFCGDEEAFYTYPNKDRSVSF